MTDSREPIPTAAQMSERTWRISAAIMLALGTILRVINLSLVPLHHDEGVNGKTLYNLVTTGAYTYNPENYHGPTLYYFGAIIPWISRLFGKFFQINYGISDFSIRFTTAVFGVATIWLILTLRHRLGRVGALTGAALLAISPGAVYLSRYFIHEALFVFFTLGAVVAILRWYETAETKYLLWGAVSAALLFATKETAMISIAVVLIAFASTAFVDRLRKRFEDRKRLASETSDQPEATRDVKASLKRFGDPSSLLITITAAVSVFAIVWILFYSSFFTNYKGIADSLETFRFWAEHSKEVHVHPWFRYFQWGLGEEAPLILLGLTGFGLALWRGTNRFAIFAGFWAFGLFAAYSLIPYKTPWLMLNFVVPLAIVSGNAGEEIYRLTWISRQRVVAIGCGTLVALLSVYQMGMLNFIHYDDPYYSYVYVHTKRDIYPLLQQIERISNFVGTGKETKIAIASPDYWPLPWYLRDWPSIDYRQGVLDFDEPIVIAEQGQQFELLSVTGNRYEFVGSNLNPAGTFALRPTVNLMLFVRRDVLEKMSQAGSR